ncbi:STE/STE7 protein kinase [Thecamonas trahens ATCC 50062]|uniref:mitogen-activated protein kinase kinase n=1 Tax=Thecamonas trahens ATCC 50062 TaxID=461836 RepID=A0A0L0DH68_THETB|nr:STE/STE7 protein kinase [Thecamonas trahens ATCC 50062]KNC51694.1 STE/STE7 protein kinase [Thecamonas trahens ATCC 50062]|eukprot:XP_013755823.1 STE/STE7 protein kinase [Thecamonas trahens ATCC 50062]
MSALGNLANLVNDLAKTDSMQDIAESIADLNHLTLKDLDLITQLGRGAYGDVFKVKVLETGEELAMKVISMLEADATHKSRTLLEVRTLHASACPHLVSFRGAFVDGDDLHILLELMWGSLEDLSELVRGVMGDDYLVPEFVVQHVAHAVTTAMRYLKKEFKVMHRDLKPANILVNSAGMAKLCDLGLSKVLTDSITKTQVGSKAYMSPERLTEPSYDVRADVWSLGLVLVELVTGEYPYAYLDQPLRILTAIAEGVVPDMPDSLPYSDECKDFIKTCLQPDPANRPKPKALIKHSFLKSKSSDSAAFADWMADLTRQYEEIHGESFN